jgi:hypothetical protein
MGLGSENKPPLPHMRGPEYKEFKQKPAGPTYNTPNTEQSSGLSEGNPWGGGEKCAWKPVGRRARQAESINGKFRH